MNMLYDRSAEQPIPGTPMWKVFTEVAYQRMMKEFHQAEYMAAPGKGTRTRLMQSMFPQVARLEEESKQNAIRKMHEWTSMGPLYVKPEESAMPPKPQLPTRKVPRIMRRHIRRLYND